MHTKADIEILEDERAVILTIGDKKLKASLTGNGYFMVMPAERLSGEWEWDEEYPDIKKLTVKVENVKEALIMVNFQPMS